MARVYDTAARPGQAAVPDTKGVNPMQFLMIYRTDERAQKGPPSPEHIAEMERFIARMAGAGILVATGGLLPSAAGAKVRSSGGKVTVTDGPFTEAKELIGGYAIVRAGSREEAIDQARQFLAVPGVADGECEVRQMHEG
jgi:hypothetical protein